MARERQEKPEDMLAGIQGAIRLFEAEALMRFSHYPDKVTFDAVMNAVKAAAEKFRTDLAKVYDWNQSDDPCPIGTEHIDSMCQGTSLLDVYVFRVPDPKRDSSGT